MAIRVTCTNCGAAYKIDETKIPPTGGAIKCQSCGTRFAVMRPPPDAAESADTETTVISQPPAPPAPVAPTQPAQETAKHRPLERSAPQPMASEATPTVPHGSPAIPLPAPPAPPATVSAETTNPKIAMPAAIPLGGETTNPKIAMAPQPKPAAIPLGGETTNPKIAMPAAPQPKPATIPLGGEVTTPGLPLPVPPPPTAPKPKATAIPLPGVGDVMSDDTPIQLTDDDDILSMDEETTQVVTKPNEGTAPLELPQSVGLPAPVAPTLRALAPAPLPSPSFTAPADLPSPLDLPPPAELPQPLDLPHSQPEHRQAEDRASAFDDLPTPALTSGNEEPSDLPDFNSSPTVIQQRPTAPEPEQQEFGGIELHSPTDLPGLAGDDALAPPDDLLASPSQSSDDVPEPLEASMPEPTSSLADDMPAPMDSPDAPDALKPDALAPPAADTDALSEALEGDAPLPKRQSRRVALLAGVLVLMTAGALVASYLLTGHMPWETAQDAGRPQPASAPTLAPLPPLPDLAALESKDLRAYTQALAVLEERRAGRKARNQPDVSGEDDAVRAKLLWHGALLLGSKALADQLEQDRIAHADGEDLHPHIERAQAALALLRGKPAEMDQKLDKLFARDKGDNDALLIRGYAKLAANDTIGASKAFDDVLKINGKNVAALLGHADVARRAQDRDGAASYVEQAETAAPDNARVKLARAELQLEDPEARTQGQKTLASLPTDALGERDRARLHFALARVQAQMGLAQKARNLLQQAASEDQTAPVLRALVWQHMHAGELDKAAQAMQVATSADLDSGEAFFLAKATLLSKLGDADKLKDLAKLGAMQGMPKRATLYANALAVETQAASKGKAAPLALKAYAAAAKADKTFSWPVLADVRLRAQKAKVKLVRLGLVAKIAGDAPATAAYADALYDEGQFKAAAERYEQALDKDPWLLDLARISERYALALQKAGRQQDAARILIASQTVDAKDPKAVLEAATIAKNAGAFEEGQRLVEQGLEVNPKDTQLRIALAEMMAGRNNADKARGILQQLLKDDDKNPLVHEAMARTYHPAEPDMVKLHIKKAIELNPNEVRFHVLLADSYFAKAKYDEAHDAYERAHELDAKNVDVMVQLSRVADLRGKKKEALDRMREALKLDPTRRALVLELGERLEDSDQRGEALKLYQDALKREPQQADLLARIGRVHQGTGNRPAALKAYMLALKANPNDPQVHYRLGYLYKDGGQAKQAIKEFEQYLKLSPKADDRKDIEAELQDLKK